MALNPGRNTRGVLSFEFDDSDRVVPVSLDGVEGFEVAGGLATVGRG